MKKAVILLSGGLDSATCLAIAQDRGFQCYALSMDYGQKNHAELHAAKKIAQFFRVQQHRVVTLSIGEFGGSALTDHTVPVPTSSVHTDAIPITYVPARNTIFLSIALGLAETIRADTIFIGANAVDFSGYPDCRPQYFEKFQALANCATKASTTGEKIHIETPLLHLKKSEIILLGSALNVDYALTVSCYQADHDGRACGMCDACLLRKKGFLEAKLADPTRYV